MLYKFILLGILVGGCVSLPMLFELNPGAAARWYAAMMSDTDTPVREEAAPVAARSIRHMPAPTGRSVQVASDPQGHFVTAFRLNGRTLDALIDTGATVIAINRTTARRIGLPVANADFKYEVRTANGSARAAAAVIERVEVGRIVLDDVEAMVLDDKALDGVLVGMSFLGRLQKFQIEDGTLLLQQ